MPKSRAQERGLKSSSPLSKKRQIPDCIRDRLFRREAEECQVGILGLTLDLRVVRRFQELWQVILIIGLWLQEPCNQLLALWIEGVHQGCRVDLTLEQLPGRRAL